MITVPAGVSSTRSNRPRTRVGPSAKPNSCSTAVGFATGGLLLVVEARQRQDARPLALLLVLAREKALVAPGVVERAQQILERGEVAGRPPPQIELDGGVQRAPVHHGVVLAKRDAQDVHVVVLERARLVVVHLVVAHHQLRVRGQGLAERVGRRRWRVAAQLLDRLRAQRAHRRLRQVERLEDELAHLPVALRPHALGAREVEPSPWPASCPRRRAAALPAGESRPTAACP